MRQHEPISFELNLEQRDWLAYQQVLDSLLSEKAARWSDKRWLKITTWLGLVVLFLLLWRFVGDFHWPTATIITVIFVLISSFFLFSLQQLRRAYRPSEHGLFTGTHQFTLSDEGIEIHGAYYQARIDWPQVLKIHQQGGLIILFVDNAQAVILPEHQLNQPTQVLNSARAMHTQAQIRHR